MGGSSSSEAFNYDLQLSSDTVLQTNEVKGSQEDGWGPIYRDVLGPQNQEPLLSLPSFDQKVTTLYEVFQRGVRVGGDNKCLGTRIHNEDGSRGEYVWETYTEVSNDAKVIGSGLLAIGAEAKANVGIFAENRAEWIKMQQGCYAQNMRVVSLYASLGKDAVEYIATHAEIKYMAISKPNLAGVLNVLDKIGAKNEQGFLEYLIVFDTNEKYGNKGDVVSDEDIKAAEAHGVSVVLFSELLKKGAETPADNNPPTPDDLAFLMYTSGTTGVPKGAMLSHKNIVAAVAAADTRFQLSATDRHLSYLPLAHIFETAVQCAIYAQGGAVGMFQGNVKMLTLDLAELKPTILCGVPRVFSKIYQKFWAGIEQKKCVPKWYVNKAYNGQCELVRNGQPRDPTYDRKVFDMVQDKLGLKDCRVIITGAAPCPPYLMEFLKIAINADVLQGYGMTETAAIISVMVDTDNNTGHVGPPCACSEVRLQDVPEMGYGHSNEKNPRTGEICVRGDNVFVGYFKNEEATAKTIVDGWLHTGDIGRWNPNGTLSIIDRRKNIFKMSQGEYIAAEKIELVYAKSPSIGQIWIYGNSYKSFVLAVVVPNAEFIVNYAKGQGWWPTDHVLASPEFIAAFSKLFADRGDALKTVIFNSMKEQNQHLLGFEKARDIIIEADLDGMLAGFTEVNQCLTPTFKLRRPYLLNRYVSQLKKAYADNNEPNDATEHWPGLDKKTVATE